MSYKTFDPALVADSTGGAIAWQKQVQKIPWWFEIVASQFDVLLMMPKKLELQDMVLQ